MAPRLRILGAAVTAAFLTLGAILAMLKGDLLSTYIGSGLLCLALPLTALAGWRAIHWPPREPRAYEFGPATPTIHALHIGTWTGIATGSAIWLLAPLTLKFEGDAGFWIAGVLGAVVGYGMAGAMLWSMAHPFPAVRADAAGIGVGGGLVTPWRDIGGVAYRRSATGFSHIEISLTNGEVLKPKIPLTVGLEDIGAFFAVVGQHLPASEPARLAQATVH
jgi:hypothetical protein